MGEEAPGSPAFSSEGKEGTVTPSELYFYSSYFSPHTALSTPHTPHSPPCVTHHTPPTLYSTAPYTVHPATIDTPLPQRDKAYPIPIQ